MATCDKRFIGAILLLLLTNAVKSQACDVTTNCEYCCITKTDGSVVCEDNLIECRLKNPRDFFGVILLLLIITFWCILVPLLVSCSQMCLLGQCLFGLTFYEVLQKLCCCCNSKKKQATLDSRKQKVKVVPADAVSLGETQEAC